MRDRLFADPTWVGCVRCGGEFHADFAVYVQCDECGKICGLCLGCDRAMARSFLDDSLDWHQQRRHPDLALPEKQRARLTRAHFGFSPSNPLVL
jgi:hypothetical protein